MGAIETALIIGGSTAGMSAALELRKQGVAVDLIDRDPGWRVYGAGITITGPTLRALYQIGVYDQVRAHGYTGDGIRVCGPDGNLIEVLPTPRAIGVDLPGSGGVMRPTLHRIFSERVIASGTRVSLGLTAERLIDQGGSVEARFSDGSSQSYDLVVGADGINSQVRRLILPDAPTPFYTGQNCWRVTVPRSPEINHRHFYLGGPVKVGLSPVSASEMYMFLLETCDFPLWIDEDRLHVTLSKLLEPYGGPLGEVRAGLSNSSRIVLRPLAGLRLDPPWSSGRVILIGDAAHPTTPQLASGAGLAIEDGLVLGQEIGRAGSLAEALERFVQRRHARCRLVVDNSLEIGRREQARAAPDQQTRLVAESLAILAQPI